jgi:hypothetical protein
MNDKARCVRRRTPKAVDLGTAQRTLFLAATRTDWTAESIMKIGECRISGRGGGWGVGSRRRRSELSLFRSPDPFLTVRSGV